MKTTISIPDPVFLAAEQLGHQMGLSRSELYTKAICNYLTTYRYNNVTALLNQIYQEEDSSVDPALQQLQIQSLFQDETW